MEIVREEPGRLVVIEETDGRIPLALLGAGLVVVLLVALPWRGLAAVLLHGAAWESVELGEPGVWLVLGALFLASLRGGSRLERLAADRDAGRAEWSSSHLGGLVHWGGQVPLEALDGLALAMVPPAGSPTTAPKADGPGLPLRLTLRRRGGRGRDLLLRVKGIAQKDHVADLAMRLGAAAGLSYYRVGQNDGPLFEIEVLAEGGPGLRALTLSGAAGPASSSARSAAADTRLAPFDPGAFRGSATVAVWEPGRRVVFAKGWRPSALLAPLVLAAALGPAAYLGLPRLRAAPLLPRSAALFLVSMSGLGLATVGLMGFVTGLPRRVAFDWAERVLRIEGPGRRRSVPLADVLRLEMVRRSHRTTGRQHETITLWHWVEMRALLRPSADGAPTDVLLVATRWYREDALSPRADARPLASELAAALGVEVREAETRASGPTSSGWR